MLYIAIGVFLMTSFVKRESGDIRTFNAMLIKQMRATISNPDMQLIPDEWFATMAYMAIALVTMLWPLLYSCIIINVMMQLLTGRR